MLPNPQIIRTTIEKVLRAFENVTRTELLKVRCQVKRGRNLLHLPGDDLIKLTPDIREDIILFRY